MTLMLLLACAAGKSVDSAPVDSEPALWEGPPQIEALLHDCADDAHRFDLRVLGSIGRAELALSSPTLTVVAEFGHVFPATEPWSTREDPDSDDRSGHHADSGGWTWPLLSLEVVPIGQMVQGEATAYTCAQYAELTGSVVLFDEAGEQVGCHSWGEHFDFHRDLLEENGVYALSDCPP